LVNCESQQLGQGILLTILHETIFLWQRNLNQKLSPPLFSTTENQLGTESSIKRPSACSLSSLFSFKLTSILRSFKEIRAGVHPLDRIKIQDIGKRGGWFKLPSVER
jgi:hypothetical protein